MRAKKPKKPKKEDILIAYMRTKGDRKKAAKLLCMREERLEILYYYHEIYPDEIEIKLIVDVRIQDPNFNQASFWAFYENLRQFTGEKDLLLRITKNKNLKSIELKGISFIDSEKCKAPESSNCKATIAIYRENKLEKFSYSYEGNFLEQQEQQTC